jgi:signal transduction histidine kinase
MIGEVRTVIVELNALRATLYSAESAQRGYLLLHRPEYLSAYNAAEANARTGIDTIRALSLMSTEGILTAQEQEWMETIPQTMTAKATEMQLTLSLALKGDMQMAKQLVNLGKGEQEMTSFIAQTQRLMDQKNKRLDGMEIERNVTLTQARTFIIGSALMQILLVVLVIRQLLRQIAVKSTMQQQLAEEVEKIERAFNEQSQMLSSLALKYQSYVERERQKLSRELHDEVGSILTAAKMDLTWAMKRLKDSAPDVSEKLKKTSVYLDQGINFKRQIVEALHPSIMTTLGLWPALRSLIEEAAERSRWQLALNLPADEVEINETISLITYRVVQETLTNASKYAEASKISVDIITDEHYLKLEMEDNGKGFDVSILDGNTHGLAGMRHRVLAIGGKFDIVSVSGNGTITRAMIPISILG